jgi:hypothetical protein
MTIASFFTALLVIHVISNFQKVSSDKNVNSTINKNPKDSSSIYKMETNSSANDSILQDNLNIVQQFSEEEIVRQIMQAENYLNHDNLISLDMLDYYYSKFSKLKSVELKSDELKLLHKATLAKIETARNKLRKNLNSNLSPIKLNTKTDSAVSIPQNKIEMDTAK